MARKVDPKQERLEAALATARVRLLTRESKMRRAYNAWDKARAAVARASARLEKYEEEKALEREAVKLAKEAGDGAC